MTQKIRSEITKTMTEIDRMQQVVLDHAEKEYDKVCRMIVTEYKVNVVGNMLFSADDDHKAHKAPAQASNLFKYFKSEMNSSRVWFNKDIYYEESSRTFTVVRNLSPNDFKITNTVTGEVWRLFAYEFVIGSANYTDVVEGFPRYVHDEVSKRGKP